MPSKLAGGAVLGGQSGQGSSEVNDAWADWLTDIGGWEWFITLTFDPKKLRSPTWTRPGWGYAWDVWSQVCDFLRGDASPAFRWFAALELHTSGQPHLHVLTGWWGHHDPKTVKKVLDRNYGFCKIRALRLEVRGAAHYVTKYVSKELGEWRFSDALQDRLRRGPPDLNSGPAPYAK